MAEVGLSSSDMARWRRNFGTAASYRMVYQHLPKMQHAVVVVAPAVVAVQ